MLLITGFAVLATISVQGSTQLRTIDFTTKPLTIITDPFVYPGGFSELAGNHAVVVDQKDNRLAFVDFAQNSVRTIGRPGAGPLEYRRISSVLGLGNGSALLPDPANNRALFIGADGSLSPAEYSREVLGVAGPGNIHAVDRAGTLYILGSVAVGTTRDSLPIIRWTPATHHTDTLAWCPIVKVTFGPEQKLPNGVTSRSLHSQMFADRTMWGVLPDGGVAIVHPNPYRVEIVDIRGGRHPGPVVVRDRIKIDAAERDAVSTDRGGRAGMIPNSDFPPTYPPFEGLGTTLVATDGTIWIERQRRIADSTAVYDVFDATGKLSAQAKLRPHSKIVGFGKGFVYVMRQDTSDDFWYLEQWKRPT